MTSSHSVAHRPLVSVCMITYNHRPYIARAIDSVLVQQTDFPFEIVIGEDFSSDGTREIVLEYAAKHPGIIRLTPHPHNVGAQQNESITEKSCRGDFIAYCEGDDFWHCPQKLQLQIEQFKTSPELGLSYSDYNRFFPLSGKTIESYNKTTNNKPPAHLSIEQIVRGGNSLYILTCTVMLRRALLEQVLQSDPFLFSQHRSIVRDTSVWAEIAARSKTAYLDRSLATYTVNEESASKSPNRVKRLSFAKEVLEIALHLSRKHEFSSAEHERYQRRWAQTILRLNLHEPQGPLTAQAWQHLKGQNPAVWDRLLFLSGRYAILRKLSSFFDRRFGGKQRSPTRSR